MCTCTWVEGTILRAPEVRNTCIVRCGAEGYNFVPIGSYDRCCPKTKSIFVYLKKSLKQIATIFSVQPKIPLAAQLRRIGMYETLRINNWILDVGHINASPCAPKAHKIKIWYLGTWPHHYLVELGGSMFNTYIFFPYKKEINQLKCP